MNTRRLVFCVNSGRAGSEYLARILGSAADVRALHEAPPAMTGEHLHRAMHEPLEASRRSRWAKVEAVESTLSDMDLREVYVETNHMFIKTFHDVVLEAFAHDDLRVVVLRRNLAAVARSFVKMGYFSDTNDVWPRWMHRPDVPNALVPAPDVPGGLDQLDLVVGYLIDIEARAQHFVQDHPEVPVVEVRLEELQDRSGVDALFAALGLERTWKTRWLTGRKTNRRRRRKAEAGTSTTIAECEDRIRAYVTRCERQGIEVPTLPRLSGPGYGSRERP